MNTCIFIDEQTADYIIQIWLFYVVNKMLLLQHRNEMYIDITIIDTINILGYNFP